MDKRTTIFIIMGVSSTGKSTIGNMLSAELSIPFFDGDDFHPEENIQKMASGNPLNDDDREGWLIALNELAKSHQNRGAIIACSALKESYRNLLKKGVENIRFIYLEGTFELIRSRMEKRSSHFMPTKLLESQFETLEPPTDAITVPITNTPEEIIRNILREVNF